MTNELNKMTKRAVVLMKEQTFNGKRSVSIFVFLQNLTAACDALNIHEGTEMWLFKHYLNGSVEAAIKARFAIPTKTVRAQ